MHRTITLAAAFAASSVALAGDLNPPPGPVAPTMKQLDEVEPRTIINQQNTPGNANSTFVISQPGSYYLTENVTPFSGTTAIRVVTDDVTIDLNGFTVFGAGGPPADTIEGSFANSVTIRNGVVSGSTANGILLDDFAALENVVVRGCSSAAIRLGNSARVTGCSAILNVSGIRCGDNAVVSGCTTQGGGQGIAVGTNSVVTDCTSRNVSSSAFVIGPDSVVTRCNAHEEDGLSVPGSIGFEAGDNVTLTECTASGHGTAGFSVGSNATLERCAANDSDSDGFAAAFTGTFIACTAAGNTGPGFTAGPGASFTGCLSSGNGGTGFAAEDGATFSECRAISNNATGFVFENGGTLHGCSALGNNGPGFQGSGVVENCVAQDNNDTGFNIGANSVLTDCVSGFNDGRGFTSGENTTLTRCLADGGNGVGFQLNDGATADSCTARFTAFDGFEAENGCHLINCKAQANSGGTGIQLLGSNNTLRGCVVVDASSDGFQVNGFGNTLIDCTASGSESTGFAFFGGSNGGGHTVDGCHANGNGDFGFFVGSNQNSITNCRATRNGIEPGADSSAAGFFANSIFAAGSVFRDNVAIGNAYGFYGFFSNADLTFVANTASLSTLNNFLLTTTGNFIGDIEFTPNSGNPMANLSNN